MSETKRVGIWIRVSTDMQVREDSPEHHEKRARLYTEAKGWQVLETYRLEAVSGKSVMAHPETKRMLSDVRNGHITGLVFSKLARLARNTKELLEFAEVFQTHNADLISIGENIDTSNPAGRLFFTLIGATGQFEREELINRINSSVAIRAKLGKPIGGQAPFGYRWEDKQLVIDETEAPIRKLMYELFLQHQRKKTVARLLNEQGYRMRNGAIFYGSTVLRLLRDTTAKGERISYHTKRGTQSKRWELKPESEWIIHPCPAIISKELWNECNKLLDAQEKKVHKPGRKAVHLLSGFIKCQCGKTMYVFHDGTKVYRCKTCNTRIGVDDIDEIFLTHVRDYLGNISATAYAEQSHAMLEEKKALFETATKERQKVAKRINALITLRTEQSISRERFNEQYQPLETRITQLDELLPELAAAIEVYENIRYTSKTIIQEAYTLYERWADMEFQRKRAIVELMTKRIEIQKEDIVITLAYAPPNLINAGKRAHNQIVAGMADATVVIEAGIKGGALITAEIANSYNRDVFAFPGRVDDTYSEGCNFLIRHNKAGLLTCAADLAYSMGWEISEQNKPVEQFALPFDLSADELVIFNVIQQHKTPVAIDDLSLKIEMPTSQIAMSLLNMEMQGYIRSLPGKMYKIG